MAAIRFTPYATAGGAGSSCAVSENTRFKTAPTPVTMIIEHKANVRMTNGSDRVSPYNRESGLKSGAVMAKARITPTETPERRIWRRIGMTPSEQTGNSIPISHAWGNSRQVPQPNSRRVLCGPSKRWKTAATTSPTRIVGAAMIAAWARRRNAPQKMTSNIARPPFGPRTQAPRTKLVPKGVALG